MSSKTERFNFQTSPYIFYSVAAATDGTSDVQTLGPAILAGFTRPVNPMNTLGMLVEPYAAGQAGLVTLDASTRMFLWAVRDGGIGTWELSVRLGRATGAQLGDSAYVIGNATVDGPSESGIAPHVIPNESQFQDEDVPGIYDQALPTPFLQGDANNAEDNILMCELTVLPGAATVQNVQVFFMLLPSLAGSRVGLLGGRGNDLAKPSPSLNPVP